MNYSAGVKCEACDNPVVLFSREKDNLLVRVECPKCKTEHKVNLDDVIWGSSLFCCDIELLPGDFDEDDDLILEIRCANCRAENPVSMEDALDNLEEARIDYVRTIF